MNQNNANDLGSRLSGGIAAEERAGSRKLVAGGSWATISIYPATVIAGDKARTATLHLTEGRTGAGNTAWVRRWRTVAWSCRDADDEGDETEQEGSHDVENLVG